MSIRQKNVRPRSDLSFEQGMREPLLRTGSDMPIEMREFRSSSIKRVAQRFMEAEDEPRVRVSTRSVMGHIVPLSWREGDCCTKCMLVMSFWLALLLLILVIMAPLALKFAVDGLSIAFKNSIAILALGDLALQAAQVFPKSWDNDMSPVFWVCIYVGLRVLIGLVLELRNWCFASSISGGETAISREAMTHVMRQSLAYHQRRDKTKVLKVITRAALGFGTVTRMHLLHIIPLFIQLIFITVVFLLLLPWYYAVVFVGAVILYLLVSWCLFTCRAKMLSAKGKCEHDFTQKAQDALNYFESVKYFNAEEHEINRYVEALHLYRNETLHVAGSVVGIVFIQQLLMAIGFCALLIWGCYDLGDVDIELGDWVMILAFLLHIYPQLTSLSTWCRMVRQGCKDAEDMSNLMRKGERVTEPMAPAVARFKQGRIEFKNVSFSYEKGYVPKPRYVLKNVNFVIEPGERVAIVGPSGCGKSTIMRLLYRFYDVHGGEITLDGYDIRSIKSKDLRGAVAIVPQDCALFNDTIQYNIGYGGVSQDDKSVEDLQAIETAARKAGVLDYILSRSDDYKTNVGQVQIAQVEKQRLAVARALLKHGAVVFCVDAATSTLDSLDEANVQQSIRNVTQGVTTLIIAHRLAAIQDCDKIIVLKHGFVAEIGKHDELVGMRDGIYRRMWDEQQRMVKDEMEEALMDQKHPHRPATMPDAQGISYSE